MIPPFRYSASHRTPGGYWRRSSRAARHTATFYEGPVHTWEALGFRICTRFR